MSPQGFSGMQALALVTGTRSSQKPSVSTNVWKRGVNGWLMKFTVAVKWWIGRKAKKFVMLVKWDASYGNACSSFKQKISIWNSFNGIDQSTKHHFQQRPEGDARKKIRQEMRGWAGTIGASLQRPQAIWPVFTCFPQLLTLSHSLWSPLCCCLSSLSSAF